jgi:hypothetical protein
MLIDLQATTAVPKEILERQLVKKENTATPQGYLFPGQVCRRLM